MTGPNIEVLSSSFEVAKPHAELIVHDMFRLLFEDYPDSKAFFVNTEMSKHEKVLLNSLVTIVNKLNNLPDLISYLEELGRKHAHLNLTDEHYNWVGSSLLKSMAIHLKEAWSEDIEKAWAEAYGIIANTMMKGADTV